MQATRQEGFVGALDAAGRSRGGQIAFSPLAPTLTGHLLAVGAVPARYKGWHSSPRRHCGGAPVDLWHGSRDGRVMVGGDMAVTAPPQAITVLPFQEVETLN